MSKITFRADEDLVRAVESLDASKSEVMRDALREYLDRQSASDDRQGSLDDLVAERVDAIIEERLRGGVPDVNVNVTVDDERVRATPERGERVPRRPREPRELDAESTCAQCGEDVDADHVYCPNCGEKTSERSFCECGDELRADWAFCPACGRRTPSADVFRQ